MILLHGYAPNIYTCFKRYRNSFVFFLEVIDEIINPSSQLDLWSKFYFFFLLLTIIQALTTSPEIPDILIYRGSVGVIGSQWYFCTTFPHLIFSEATCSQLQIRLHVGRRYRHCMSAPIQFQRMIFIYKTKVDSLQSCFTCQPGYFYIESECMV